MRLKRLKALWMAAGAAALMLLTGCSTLRLAYDNGPLLAWWWVDGYADFTGAEAARVKDGIRQWFAWHRKAQLPGYADTLSAVRNSYAQSVTPAQVCQTWADGRKRLEPALEQALQLAATWTPGLTDEQFRHLERKYADNLDEMRRDFLQADPAARQEAALARTRKRVEEFYGRLDEPQLQVIVAGLKASPFDPEAWLAERQRRQQDTLQTLRVLRAERAGPDASVAALRALLARAEYAPGTAYRDYQQRLSDYNCAFAARLHNAMGPRQLQALQNRLKGWEDDLRALAAAEP